MEENEKISETVKGSSLFHNVKLSENLLTKEVSVGGGEGGASSAAGGSGGIGIPKLMSLASTRVATAKTKPLSLPQVQGNLSHDHNAFLCSLFNKIDLNTAQRDGQVGPFSTIAKSGESLIAEAVEQNPPKGDEDLPQYNTTISSMVINAHKKVFSSKHETNSSQYIRDSSSLSSSKLDSAAVSSDVKNINCMLLHRLTEKQPINDVLTEKPCLRSARLAHHAPYNTALRHHTEHDHHYDQDADQYNTPHTHTDSHSPHAKSTSDCQGSTDCHINTARDAPIDYMSFRACPLCELQSPPKTTRSPKDAGAPDGGVIGPHRVRRISSRRDSAGSAAAGGNAPLTKNEARLFEAVTVNNVGLASVLLSSDGGAVNPSVADSCGRTPLHLTAAHGYTALLKLLLQHGADHNKVDSIGNKPLDLALSGRQTPAAVYLITAHLWLPRTTTAAAAASEDASSTAVAESLTALAQQLLRDLANTRHNPANIHLARLHQTVEVLRHAMDVYHFSCPEVDEIMGTLRECNLADPAAAGPLSAVDELSKAISKSLYFDR